MKIKPQIRWVAVNSKGEICGPCMKTMEKVKKAMMEGFSRVIKTQSKWEDLVKMGYNVIECHIIPVNEEEEIENKIPG